MTRFIWCALTGVLCFCALAAHGQTYHIYRPSPRRFSAPLLPKESKADVSVSALSSRGFIEDIAGERVSAHMEGARLRMSARPWRGFAVGAEATYMAAFDYPKLLAHMRRQSLSVFARWTVTPHASPRLYVFAGGGAVYNQSKFVYSRENLNHGSGLFFVGLGQECEIAKRWALLAEFRVSYDAVPWKNFAFSAPVWRTEWALGLSVRL